VDVILVPSKVLIKILDDCINILDKFVDLSSYIINCEFIYFVVLLRCYNISISLSSIKIIKL